MKNKNIEIRVPIYRMSVIIFFDSTLDEIIKYGIKHKIKKERFSNNWKEEVKDMIDSDINGFTVDYGENNRDILIWLRKKPEKMSEYGVLYHELYHAVDIIAVDCDDSHMFYNKHGMSEPRAYLYEFLINCCNTVLWK